MAQLTGEARPQTPKAVKAPRPLGLLAVFVALATLHTWPMPSDPAHWTRLDNDDTAFNTWVVAWVAHQVATDPLRLFEAPIFHPARHALAFSEHLVVQSVIGAPLLWAGASPVLVYNLLVWVGFVLSGVAMAWLMQTWTGSTTAGIVSGCLYAFNAHLLTRYSHLQAMHLQFFPLTLYALDRLLTRRPGTPAVRLSVLLGTSFVLQALCSNYMLVMMTFALVVAVSVRPELWRFERSVWQPLAITGACASLVLIPFLWPYYRVREEYGMARTIEEVRFYSASWLDYLVTAARLHYNAWSYRVFEGRTALFPGALATLLAGAAVVAGPGWRDRRLRMALAFGLTGFALSFGARLPGYEWLQDHVPLLQGIRAAARWGLLPLIAVAVLAGATVARLETRYRARTWWPAVAVALVGIVTLEAMRAPLSMVRFDGIAPVHARLASDEVTAIAVFPIYAGEAFHANARYLLDQTRHWKPMVNAYSSFAPPSFYDHARRLQHFPDPDAMSLLRDLGISHVVLHRAAYERDFGKRALDEIRAHPGLQFLLEQDGVTIYRRR